MEFKNLKKAFTAILVGSILAIMIGAILLIISYVVIAAIMNAMPTNFSTAGAGALGTAGSAMNLSVASSLTNIAQALNITGIGLIVAGIAGIIYMLIGLGGASGGRGR